MSDTTRELRALLAKATEGPWKQQYVKGQGLAQIWSDAAQDKSAFGNPTLQPGYIGGQFEIDGPALGFDIDGQPQCAHDAALIVAAVNALPTLLDRIEALEKIARGVAALETHGGGISFPSRELTADARTLLRDHGMGER